MYLKVFDGSKELILNEIVVEWTDVEWLCGDKNGWKQCVRKKMEHLLKWEQ